MDVRPVISRKRLVSAANKVDHIAGGPQSLPIQKKELPEVARFHAMCRPSSRTTSPTASTTRLKATRPPALNVFAERQEVPLHFGRRSSSAILLRPESRGASPSSCRESSRKHVAPLTPSSLSLSHDVSAAPTAASSGRQVASPRRAARVGAAAADASQPATRRPTTRSILAHDDTAAVPSPAGFWTTKRTAYTPGGSVSTSRVLYPEEQDMPRSRRGLAGARPVDHTGALFNRPYDQFEATKPVSLRTKIQPVSPDPPAAQRSTNNSRHMVVGLPQPSTVFGRDEGRGGLCFWDYKFSTMYNSRAHHAIHAPQQQLQRRAVTPEPKRQTRFGSDDAIDSVIRSGKKRVVPSYLQKQDDPWM